jgi:hypothetical protein
MGFTNSYWNNNRDTINSKGTILDAKRLARFLNVLQRYDFFLDWQLF